MPFTTRRPSTSTLEALRRHATPLPGAAADDRALFDLLATARFALLGEASHGTDEFYRERAAITRRLIVERGLDAVALEADWPDAHRVSRYVRGTRRRPQRRCGAGRLQALSDLDVAQHRHARVRRVAARAQRGAARRPRGSAIYGLDLYSLFTSIDAVLALPRPRRPRTPRAGRRDRYACFERFAEDSQAYGYATAVRSRRELRAGGRGAAARAGREERRALARARAGRRRCVLPRRAERAPGEERRGLLPIDVQLRASRRGTCAIATWPKRSRRSTPSGAPSTAGRRRIAVWAHNSHLGDARATEMGDGGELNLGQLVRERHGAAPCCSASAPTTAASPRPATGTCRPSRPCGPALDGSFEALFHELGIARLRLILRGNEELAALARLALPAARHRRRLPARDRAPEPLLPGRLPRQFDAIVHLDETRALVPLDRPGSAEDRGDAPRAAPDREAPETFPSGV